MNVPRWIAALALGAALAVPSGAMAQAGAAAKVDDSAIKSRIETRLKNAASLKDDTITVAVAGGVVTLTGTVDSQVQKLRAAELARVSGVTNVENNLDVDSKTERTMDKAAAKADKTTDKAAAKTDKAMDKAGDKADKAGDKAKEATGTAGEAITDAWITTKIKADYINEDTLKGSDINVDTNNHVVTLKGTVASLAGKSRAEQIAKTTKGVTRVVNTLTVTAK